MSPADALDQLNRDRGKLISKVDGRFVLEPASGEVEARQRYLATTVADDTSPFTTDATYTSPPNLYSSPTLGQQQALRNMKPASTASQGLPWDRNNTGKY